MVRDMLALGHREPAIEEIAGPYVRVALVGVREPRDVIGLHLERVRGAPACEGI